VIDTLVLSRLVYGDLGDEDRAKRQSLPNRLKGSHSLAAWGQRLGCHKGDYQGGWEHYSQEMLDYCVQDTAVTLQLWQKIRSSKKLSRTAVVLEHKVQWVISRQERHGFLFDESKAHALCQKLSRKRAEIEQQLQTVFAPWWTDLGVVTPTRTANYKNKKRASITKDVPFSKCVLNVFNPGSRHHIANRLIAKGWIPKIKTPDGRPKLDEKILAELPYPEAKLLSEYFLVQKRLGMLSDGRHSWLSSVKNTGRIHGSVLTCGTVTGRASMRNPNLQQVPSTNSPYGDECRALFKVPEGKSLVGVDMSGIELRLLGHFTYKFDKGVYAHEVVDGDIHTHNQRVTGLASRSVCKSFIYAVVYGGGANRLAQVASIGQKEAVKAKNKLLAGNPGLEKLIKAVQASVVAKGYITGLDKRHLPVREAYRALNVVLQSAGAITAKAWLVEFDNQIAKRGWRDRVQQVAWIHDEIQIEADTDLAEDVGKIAVDAIATAGEQFKLNVPLTGEYKIGNSWADTH
jgi:DNA polymerase I-like protein with 3'-5' exonuclease and polymerase domains